MAMKSKFSKMTPSSSFYFFIFLFFFWCVLLTPVNFSYWPKFRVNIITDFRVMAISFYKGLIRNTEIGYAPFWVLPNIWRLGQVKNIKIGMNIFNKMLLNVVKCRVIAFTVSHLLKENQQGKNALIQISVKKRNVFATIC